MFDIFGGFKRYEFDSEERMVSEREKDVKAVKYWIFSYAVILIFWHGFFSLLLEDFDLTRILLAFIINPIIWYWFGFTFATDNDRGHNLFIVVCAIIFEVIVQVRVLFQFGLYCGVWNEVGWVIFLYIICAKVGTKFAP